MWFLLLIYLWPIVLGGKSIIPYDTLYGMEPYRSEASEAKATHSISGVWNLGSLDAIYTTVPMAAATKRELGSGYLPVWDTNTLTGFPLGAFYSTYPINLIAITFLSPERALAIETFFHLLLLSLFAYLIIVSLGSDPLAGVVAGIAASTNGIVIYYLISPAHLPAAAWMLGPFLCLLRFKKQRNWRWTLVAGICYGMLISTTNAQSLLYTSMAYGAYAVCLIGIELWRRAAPRALAHLLHSLGMVVIGILLGLPTLIMIIQFKSGIDRAPLVFPKIPFHSWIWMFIPFYWGDVLPPSNLVSAMPLHARVYIGVIPLAFAITALVFSKKAESKIWMGLAASLFAITMGLPPFTYLFSVLSQR